MAKTGRSIGTNVSSELFDRVLAMLAEPGVPNAPLGTAERRLSGLFRTLAESDAVPERAESEDLIWALWCLHPDPDAERRMQRLIGALARDDRGHARPLADALVLDFPDWAEAWNKRATLAFIEGRDADSIADIECALALEPRHFGAVCGFAQIAERHGNPLAALLGYEYALRFNPNLDSIRVRARQLRAKDQRVVH